MAVTAGRSQLADDRVIREEGGLARAAAGGDGSAFATLYDRYESRIFTFCQRLTGNPEDAADATQEAFVKVLQRLPRLEGRELNFGAYLFTAARNASYDVIGHRKKAQPVDEIPEYGGGAGAREPGDLDIDPERAALVGAQQEEIRAANLGLPERQREVLALRELEDLSYDEIAEIMHMNRNSVAQLISRARMNLRTNLRGGALAAIAVTSPDCERALPLLAARDDGQLNDGADAEWLSGHVAGCATCQASSESMQEAGVSYRAWLPIVPLVYLRQAAIAKAGERLGHDWSEVARSPRNAPGGDSSNGDPAAGGSGGSAGGAAASAAIAGAGVETDAAAAAVTGDLDGAVAAGEVTTRSRRRRRRSALAGLLAGLLLLGILATQVGADSVVPKIEAAGIAPGILDTPPVEPEPGVTTTGAGGTTGQSGAGNGTTGANGSKAHPPAGSTPTTGSTGMSTGISVTTGGASTTGRATTSGPSGTTGRGGKTTGTSGGTSGTTGTTSGAISGGTTTGGTSGASATSGTTGTTGTSFTTGTSGTAGTAGTASGTSGTSGTTGCPPAGTVAPGCGTAGTSGTAGTTGAPSGSTTRPIGTTGSTSRTPGTTGRTPGTTSTGTTRPPR
jgi:RNA polymerase sigma factor (sigma-70 family)